MRKKDDKQPKKYKIDTLKKCPCCKGIPEVLDMPMAFGRYSVHCTSCGLSTRWCKTIAEARMLWNYRGE